MFNFKYLFSKYSRPFTAIVDGKDGYYDDETGEYVPPSEPSEKEYEGIILQLNDDDLQFEEGGTLTRKDRKILLDTNKYSLKQNQKVLINDETYRVHHIAPYNLYSHFEKVIVKRVSKDD